MKNLIGKKIATVQEYDTRFLEHETIEDAFVRDTSFSKRLTITFEDGTRLVVEPVQDRFGDDLIGVALVDEPLREVEGGTD